MQEQRAGQHCRSSIERGSMFEFKPKHMPDKYFSTCIKKFCDLRNIITEKHARYKLQSSLSNSLSYKDCMQPSKQSIVPMSQVIKQPMSQVWRQVFINNHPVQKEASILHQIQEHHYKNTPKSLFQGEPSVL